jgi:hypothetical protein
MRSKIAIDEVEIADRFHCLRQQQQQLVTISWTYICQIGPH